MGKEHPQAHEELGACLLFPTLLSLGPGRCLEGIREDFTEVTAVEV